MDRATNPIERAYILARSGRYRSVTEITKQLKAEGYELVESHLAGAGIRRELVAVARADGAPPSKDMQRHIEKKERQRLAGADGNAEQLPRSEGRMKKAVSAGG